MTEPIPLDRPRLRVGYLSAGLRASTLPNSREGAPRAHMLGMIEAFERYGWPVDRFIVGDRMTAATRSEKTSSGRSSLLIGVAADMARLGLGPVNAFRAWRELGQSVDFVYERGSPLQSLGQVFKRRGIPWILETNAVQFLEAKSERNSLTLPAVARLQEINAYRTADIVVCQTDALKEMVVSVSEIPETKVLVIPNAVDAERFNPERYPRDMRPDRLTVGFVGSLYPWQGIDHLIVALSALPAEVAIEATIVGNGPAKADWEALAAARGVGDRVRFTGRADWDEIPELIAGFDLGFSGQQPSRSDPRVYFSPIKLYEYMAMARPVIASATEDARALLAADNVGYLYEVGDIDGLRNALQRAWEERASLRERGQLARQMIVREHTWDQRVKLLESRMTPLLAEQYARFR